MTKKREPRRKWHLATWKGSRRQQHREFLALPFSRKLEIVEEMGALAAKLRGALEAESPAAFREVSKPHRDKQR